MFNQESRHVVETVSGFAVHLLIGKHQCRAGILEGRDDGTAFPALVVEERPGLVRENAIEDGVSQLAWQL
jgi:hypothetical protein